jgi:hypothetical protein
MSIFSAHNPPSKPLPQAAEKRTVISPQKSPDIGPWRHRLRRKWVITSAAATAMAFGAFAVGAAAAEPASAKVNQAATAFYDAAGTSFLHVPIYAGAFTIVPYGHGTHITTLHWEDSNVSNICAQKVDFEALDGQNRRVWLNPGVGVFGPPCHRDFTANRAVDYSSAGVVKICGTLYFAHQTTGPNPDWYRKVQSCAIM